MKFKNKTTGVILEPSNDVVEKMLKESEQYEEVKEKNKTLKEKAE